MAKVYKHRRIADIVCLAFSHKRIVLQKVLLLGCTVSISVARSWHIVETRTFVNLGTLL